AATNASGHFLVQHSIFRDNAVGASFNSSGSDPPPPQFGSCTAGRNRSPAPTLTTTRLARCTIFRDNQVVDNDSLDVPTNTAGVRTPSHPVSSRHCAPSGPCPRRSTPRPARRPAPPGPAGSGAAADHARPVPGRAARPALPSLIVGRIDKGRRAPRKDVAQPRPRSTYRHVVTFAKGAMRMASQTADREMISERVAPGMLPRVLNSFDMTIIFVAIVLFIVNASAIQQAHQAAYTYWILGFLAFLIPGALVTAQLGQMFPQEGSLYVWTQKALGPFWGFFAGFCAWWPGILVMVATGDAVVTIWQFIDTGGLSKAWEQGLVILAVLWFSAFMSMLRLRMTQSYANWAVVFYGAGIFVIGLAGILWLIGDGHSATG